MSILLQHRVSNLEAEVKALKEIVAALTAPPERKNPNGPRQMCPKCGVEPNYHLHVKNCKGKKLEQVI